MSRTARKEMLSNRLKAIVARAKAAPPFSAAQLLQDESKRLKALQPFGNIHGQRQVARIGWAFEVAAAWLDSRNDPAMLRRWAEVPHELDSQNVEPTGGSTSH